VDQRVNAIAMAASDGSREISDGVLVGEITPVWVRSMALSQQVVCSRRGFLELTIDEHERSALVGKGTRDDFSNLAFGSNAGDDDGRTSEHRTGDDGRATRDDGRGTTGYCGNVQRFRGNP
jgi:hypothetical protein